MPPLRTLVLGALLLAPATLVAQDRQTEANAFTLNDKVPTGQWIRVRNVNGDVRVRPSTSDRVEITATKTWRRGDPKDVRIQSYKASDGSILVCAFWTENATCDENGYQSHNEGWRRDRNNDVAVDFEVRVPKGVKVGVNSVNGGVSVDGATSEVRASTVNGRVSAASTGGPVNASTVNGDIDVRMRELGTGDLEYSTVNGSIEIEVPSNLDADLDMRTVNGSLSADFPITLQGRVNPRRMRATIGKGGRRIRLETVNGSVELRKSS